MGQHPAKSQSEEPCLLQPHLYKQRNLIERFFNKLKYFRRIATRYDKLGSVFLVMTKLACIRLRFNIMRSRPNGPKVLYCNLIYLSP